MDELASAAPQGKVADYIPELSKVAQDQFAVYLQCINGDNFGYGDFKQNFSIQSISKMFSLAMAYAIMGEKIRNRVDVVPPGKFSVPDGLPGESGVGGGIAAVYPAKYSITTWAPRLNKSGNSYRGMKFLEAFTTKTGYSIF